MNSHLLRLHHVIKGYTGSAKNMFTFVAHGDFDSDKDYNVKGFVKTNIHSLEYRCSHVS
jgi:hypothetical protein